MEEQVEAGGPSSHEKIPADISKPTPLGQLDEGPAYSSFSRPQKLLITAMVVAASFVSPMTACIYFPILNALSADIGVSIALVNLTITSYMVFQGLMPTLYGDFSDSAGRRPAYLIAFAIYLVANIGLALQHNYAALLVLRCLQSAGGSGTLAIGFATVADISTTSERGRYMGFVGAGINVGPTLGPVIGGLLSQFFGWRSIFWFCAIFAAVWLIPYALLIPETCRNIVGDGSIRAQSWNLPLTHLCQPLSASGSEAQVSHPIRRIRFPNPLRTLRVVLDPEMAIILVFNSLLYVAFVDVGATLGTQFKAIYGFNDLQLGLCYIPYGLGCCVAAVSQGYLLDWNYQRVAKNIGFTIDRRRGDDLSKFPIEMARVQPMYPLLLVGVLALAGYGWVLQAETGLAAPLALLTIVGMCIPGSSGIFSTLIVDLYPEAPATAAAANNLVRCSLGAVGTGVIESMIEGMGRGWCFSFLAAVCAAVLITLPVLEKRGPAWREMRRTKRADPRRALVAR